MKTRTLTAIILFTALAFAHCARIQAQTCEQKLTMATQIAQQTLDEKAKLQTQVNALETEKAALKSVITIDAQIQANDQTIIKLQMDLIERLEKLVGKKSGFKLICIFCR